MPLARLFAVLTLGLALPAQDPAPPMTQRIRIVGEVDGLPRPGVLVHAPGEPGPIVSTGGFRVLVHGPGIAEPIDDTDDFFLGTTPAVAKLLATTKTYRSDPAGEILVEGEAAKGLSTLFVGEPYLEIGRAVDAHGVSIWKVRQQEPVGVRVVDMAGRPLPRFPVALRAAGRDLCVALTDAEGRALLGLPAEFTARVQVAPAGWIGSYESMPTLASAIPGKRGCDLVVPPYGTLRFRTLRAGLPVRTRLSAGGLGANGEPRSGTNFAIVGSPRGLGIDVPYVAVGADVRAHIALDELPFWDGTSPRNAIEATGPLHAGQTKEVDIELPWEPVLRFVFAGPASGVRHPLHVRIVTDIGTYAATSTGAVCEDSQVKVSDVRGSRLRRADFDVFEPANGADPPRMWAVSLPLDRRLALPGVDLGEVSLQQVPSLRGRVLDPEGKPIADARVFAWADSDTTQDLRTDDLGRFAWSKPLPRDGGGALVAFRVHAGKDMLRCDTRRVDPTGDEVVLRLTPVPSGVVKPTPPQRLNNGSFEVLVADSPPNLVDSFWRAVSDDGQHAPPRIEKTKGGWRLRFANLVRGSHTISYQDPMRAIVALNGVVVPDDGPSRDERLARVSLRDGITAIAFHIVDAQDIPIAGARVTGRGFQVWTDGSGKTGFATCAPDATAATIEARGFRPRELPALTDGLRIALAPASTFLVALKGLPADAPRDRLSVWVRSERDNFTGPHVALGIGDATELVAPVNGRYRMHLMIRGAKAGNFVAVCPEAVELAYGTIPPIEWKLDEPALANLRLLTK